MQKRTQITIETERLLVVNQRRDRTVLWCSDCEKNVPMVNVSEVARIAGVTPMEIFRWAKAGTLHFAVTPEGRLFICANSF